MAHTPTTPGLADPRHRGATPLTLTPATPGLAEPRKRHAALVTLTPTTPGLAEPRNLCGMPRIRSTASSVGSYPLHPGVFTHLRMRPARNNFRTIPQAVECPTLPGSPLMASPFPLSSLPAC